MSEDKSVILVTGGSGLVGRAIRTFIEEERKLDSKLVRNETWIFCGSNDGDLR